jgi:hypothetical protein
VNANTANLSRIRHNHQLWTTHFYTNQLRPTALPCAMRSPKNNYSRCLPNLKSGKSHNLIPFTFCWKALKRKPMDVNSYLLWPNIFLPKLFICLDLNVKMTTTKQASTKCLESSYPAPVSSPRDSLLSSALFTTPCLLHSQQDPLTFLNRLILTLIWLWVATDKAF